MPPEPLPWNRKDFARWRDPSSSSSSSYGGSRNNDFSPRWGFSSEYRRSPGHGKQNGWHMYSEESAHMYPTARSADQFLYDNGFKPSMSRGDGRYGRFYRGNRASFGQKGWRGHSWEASHHHHVPPNAPGKPHFMNDQRSVGDSPIPASHPHSDPCDQSHSKDQADKTSDVNGSGVGQRVDKEKSPGSLDWKPLKWSRSGSLTSRGSGFSHSSSSKTIGGESNDLKGDLSVKVVSPIQSPSGDAVACENSVVPLEETTSRKKPRLGWGEGLAKYEKKKVEDPEENASKMENAALSNSVEPTHSLISNVIDKSPWVVGFSDCSSPATPSSVACSSSPVLEDKAYANTTDADGDANNFSVTSMPVCENKLEGLHFSLEKLELNSITNLSSLLKQLLQADDQYSVDFGFVKSSALNKLLLWKGDISKELELTETEIDSLDDELKSLKSDSGSNRAFPASLNSLSAECKDEPHEDVNMVPRPPPLKVASSGDMLVGEMLPLPCDDVRRAHTHNKDEDIDSPGTATSKFVETLTPQNLVSADSWKNCSLQYTNLDESTRTMTQNLAMHSDATNTVEASSLSDDRKVTHVGTNQGVCDLREDSICDTVFASNKDSAARASEVLFKLLPSGDCRVDSAEAKEASCLSADLTVREKFLRRIQSLRFKEKVIASKYRAFQHLWKEDLRLLSLKCHRTKLQKKKDLNSRTLQSGNQKDRSSIRSRFSSPAGSSSLVPTAEIISFTGKLLSDSHVNIHRSSLKMPAMILDEKEKMLSRFVSSNGLVEDPCAIEKERALINPWTAEEKEIFMDKLATYDKDFSKIASFLDHKTTADCIDFYYKNHKSECFEKIKKSENKKQGKPLSTNTYLLTSGKKWAREMNAASLDILGEASVIAAQADEAMEPSKLLSGKFSNRKSKHGPSNYYIVEDERETEAADVLAGICGSISSEAMSSSITSSVEGNQEWKHQKVGSTGRRPLTQEVTRSVDDDDTCSDESYGEVDILDWTDDEKSLFVQAFSSYGKDFVMISRFVQTKSRDQCKVFFSKARKCLGLDNNRHPGTSMGHIHARNDANGGGSDTDDACNVETVSVVCSDKSGSRMEEDLQNISQDVSKPEAMVTGSSTLEENCARKQTDDEDTDAMQEDLLPGGHQEDVSGVALDDVTDDVTDDDTPNVEASMGVVAFEISPVVSSIAMDSVAVFGFTDEKSVAKSENGVKASSSSSSPIELGASGDGRCRQSTSRDRFLQSQSSRSIVNQSECSLLKSYPLDLSIKTEMNARTECEGQAFKDCYLRKCSQALSQNTVTELPFLVKSEEGQTNNNHSASSSKTEKPTGNGDVKLFGKILSKTASDDKPTPSAQYDNENAVSRKHEHNGFPGLESVPIRSYGFWDGTKIQTGVSSLPDSALLLAKYPAAFANYSISSSNTDVNVNKCSVNDAFVFPPSSNGSVVEYPVYKNPEPFRLETKQRHDTTTYLDMQRNGFEAISSLQLNVVQGGDILVGGSCNGISDPVAALKLHYARTQQFVVGGGHGGNGVIRDENWRGQGDVRR